MPLRSRLMLLWLLLSLISKHRRPAAAALMPHGAADELWPCLTGI